MGILLLSSFSQCKKNVFVKINLNNEPNQSQSLNGLERGLKHMAHGQKPVHQRVQSGPWDKFAKSENFMEDITAIFFNKSDCNSEQELEQYCKNIMYFYV